MKLQAHESTTQIAMQMAEGGGQSSERSEENQWPLPQTEREACFRRMIKPCFNAASAGSCIWTHSHHRAKSHNWMASGNGLTGLDDGMPCDCNGTECGIPPSFADCVKWEDFAALAGGSRLRAASGSAARITLITD